MSEGPAVGGKEEGSRPACLGACAEELLAFGHAYLAGVGSGSGDSDVAAPALSEGADACGGEEGSVSPSPAFAGGFLAKIDAGGDKVGDPEGDVVADSALSRSVDVCGGGEESASALLAFGQEYLANIDDEDDEAGDTEGSGVGVPQMSQDGDVVGGGGESASALLAFAQEYLANADDGDDEGIGKNSGAAEGRRQARNFRRGLCVQERDALVLLEVAHVKLQEQLGRQAFLEQKAAAACVLDQQRATQQLAEQKAMIKKREKARQELWSKAFGEQSFFHLSAAAGLEAGGKPSTQFPPGQLVELSAFENVLERCDSINIISS